ncbi:non-ribosomal peptide synthetase [Actinomadura rayongensis]|uniref:Amino acid adenylation domain-containing protein n=1 Tax=Actinomadura rayongensis TaxID=1429076 RepID=A0A6I4WG48_9ACTN|nr:non-ribosomal peptide synthetase [Actinomadura rayongensis]MXQ65562.1 amino acid adenylation domain-containing protein [Actinomadura rayongensis]
MSTPQPDSGHDLIRKLQALPAHRQSAVLALMRRRGVDVSALDFIPRVPRDEPIALSFAQQRLWFLAQLEGASPQYNVPIALRLDGKLDRAALRRALTGLVDRHEALRTRFEDRDGVPYQCVADGSDFTVRERDLTDADDLAELCRRETLDPFDLARDPLIRALLLRRSDTEHVLVLTIHHIASDGWSIGVLFRELNALYEAARDGRDAALDPLPLQYADFSHWQRQWLTGDVQTRQIEYWKDRLAGAEAGLTLPTDRPRPPVRGHAGAREHFRCSADLLERLRQVSGRYDATLYMTLLAAYSVVLHRYTQRTDIAVGTIVANRNRAETEGLIGLFANTLVMRNDLAGDPTFADLLAQVKQTALHAYDHQDVPFEAVVDALQVERSLSLSPVFQTVLVLQEAQADPDLRLGDLRVDPVDFAFDLAKFDLTLDLREAPDGLTGAVEYNTDLYDRATIRRFVRHFTTLLSAVADRPRERVSRLELMDAAETDRLVGEWTAPSAVPAPPPRPLHAWFEDVARDRADAVAVRCDGRELSYAELNARANRLARHLRGLGVERESPVALCLPRSEWLVVCALAVLKAGGAYVPLDPAAPPERARHVLTDSAPKVLLVAGGMPAGLDVGDVTVVDVEAGTWDGPDGNLEPLPGASASDSAYVIYTSGSTGRPKGVVVEHRQASRLFTVTEDQFRFGKDDVWTLFHSFAFDFTVWEMWGALLYGGRLVVVPHEVARSAADFYALLRAEGVTVLNQTPSAFAQLTAAQGDDGRPHKLRTVVFGGEALDTAALRPWFARPINRATTLVNMYGITETTVHVTSRVVTEADAERSASPIGAPLPDLHVYVLDGHGAPVPPGAVGEMFVGGAGVARGYLNRPELTAERFLDDPFRPGARMYRTGDLARRRADGSLEFVGRNDDQVKIRGFRIEPGEISASLRRHPGVGGCAVVVREDRPGVRQLVAYVVPAAEAAEGLRAELDDLARRSLPDYMRPASYVLLDRLPLTTNGKLDTAALPVPDIGSYREEREHVAPSTPTERALAAIWADLLGFPAGQIGVADNFFALGGHSLLVTVLAARLREQGLTGLTVRDLFSVPTLAALAALIDAGDGAPAGRAAVVPPNLVPDGCERLTPDLLPLVALDQEYLDAIAAHVPGGAPNIQDVYPLVPSQDGILFHHLMDPENDPYVMSGMFVADDEAACAAFLDALQTLIDRHDVMRTAVLTAGLPEPVQVVYRSATLPVERIEPVGDAEAHARALLADPAVLPPDRPPMLKVRLVPDPVSGRRFLVVNFHHLIEDATSLRLIVDELAAHMAGRDDLIGPAPAYRDFVAHTLHNLRTGDAEAYFRDVLGDVTEPTVPFGLTNVRGDGRRTRKPRRALSPELTRRLRAESGRLGLSPAWLYHAACARVIAAAGGRDDVVFGTVMSGRLAAVPGIERMLGNFINTLPLRVRLADRTVRDLVDEVATGLRELIVREQSSLSLAQRCSGLESDTPLFSAAINFRHFDAPDEASAVPSLEALGIGSVVFVDRTNYPMGMSLDDLGDEMSLTVQIEEGVEPEALLTYVETALAGIVDALAADDGHGTRALDVDVLPAHERQRLVADGRGKTHPYEQDASLAELFERQAARRPDAVAVRCGDRTLTYAELNRDANRVAHRLRASGVGPDVLVGLCADRSPDLVTGLLGVLKAGGAYVPIDPGYPEQRVRAILDGSGVRVVLGQSTLRDGLLDGVDEVIHLDTAAHELAGMPEDDPSDVGATPAHLAYVIFTSGSTGRPKGVLVEQRGVARLVRNPDYFAADEDTVVMHHSSISFDAGPQEVLTPLLAGGVLVLHDGDSKDPAQLLDVAGRTGVTTMLLSAALLPDFVAAATGRDLPLRYLAVVGDTFSARDVRRLCAEHPDLTVVNGYGPTENSIASTYHVIPRDIADDARIPIGRPIPHTTAYVTDEAGRLVPDGVIGELCLGGAGVARGYLGDPALTAARFVPDPFGDDPGGRLYRTGDLVRRLPDGTLEFRGRADDQVKVRGFRVEPGEIETVLQAHPSVHSAVVVPRTAGEVHTLNAYLSPTEEWLDAAAEAQVAEHLGQWRRLFEEQYSRTEEETPDDLNLAGWESSYTGEPIPEAEMREWIDGTVARIAGLRPKRILEVGCGTGLLLFRYAGDCASVHGMDISGEALADVRRGAERRGWDHVTLRQGDALAVAELAGEAPFDVVVLNSVVQYFPSRAYLDEVLTRILPLVADGGRVLLGDVRNLDLFSAHVCAVERSRAGVPSTAGALAAQVQRRRRQETELLVSPAYFTGLPGRFDGLGSVDVLVKRGLGGNEMLSYRYDVVLTKGPSVPVGDHPWLDVAEPADLVALLESGAPDRFGVVGLTNPRIADDVRVEASLTALAPSRQVEPLPGGDRLSADARRRVAELEAALARAEELGYEVAATWSQDRPDGLDLVLGRGGLPPVRARAPYRNARPANVPQAGLLGGGLVRELRDHLGARLPDYMVPSAFVVLEELPVTAQGKVDKRALPAPDEQDVAKEVYVAPRTEAERTMCRLVAGVLEIERVGVQDNFFNLGGHSLLATRLNLRVKKTTGAELPLELILAAPTIGDMAAVLAEALGGAAPDSPPDLVPDAPAAEGTEAPLSTAQRDLWFLRGPDHLGAAHDNVQIALRLRGPLDPAACAGSVRVLVERHAILRTSYVRRDGVTVQRVNGADGFEVVPVAIPGDAAFDEWAQAERLRPFAPADRHMLRAHLATLADEDHVLVLTRPWGIFDGWSTGILLAELLTAYRELSDGREPLLKPLPLQYADYAVWQRSVVDGAVLDRQRDYWRTRLAGLPERPSLRTDYPRPPVRTFQGAAVEFTVPGELADRVRAFGAERKVSPYTTLLAAYAVLLGGRSDDLELAIGSPVTNRPAPELDELVGYFVNALVLRIGVAPGTSFADVLAATATTVAEAQAHRDLPFEDLARDLVPDPDPSRPPLFPAMFNLAATPGDGAQQPDTGGLDVELLPGGSGTARFDLSLSLRETGAGLLGHLEYSTDLFARATAERLARDYTLLLDRAVRHPDRDLDRLRSEPGENPTQQDLSGTQEKEAERE